MSGYQVMPRLSPDEYADLEAPEEGRILTGTCESPFALIEIEESDSDPGYHTIKVIHAEGKYVTEPNRPVRMNDFGKEFMAEFIRRELGGVGIKWRTEERTPIEAHHPSVYFIADEEGFVKIGTAMNVQSRMSTLQTASRQELRLIGSIPGGADVEHALHRRFASCRIRGEWFLPSSELNDFLEEVVK